MMWMAGQCMIANICNPPDSLNLDVLVPSPFLHNIGFIMSTATEIRSMLKQSMRGHFKQT